MNGSQIFIVSNIKLPINASFEEAFSVAMQRLKKAGILPEKNSFRIFKRSIDARDKNDIKFVYSVCCNSYSSRLNSADLNKYNISVSGRTSELDIVRGTVGMTERPLIVGSGPAGLFSALLLAEEGYKPIIIERGGSVSERKKAIEIFSKDRILNSETNIQFGAGGAGTFSDGKLVTRINDTLTDYVLKKLVEFGAPEEIRYLARPHIGTDILTLVIERITDKLIALGADVYYNTKYLKSETKNGVSIAKTTKGDFPYGVLILATGHSARETYKQLIDDGYAIEAKQFSVGMRIEHLSSDIDRAMFGKFAGNEKLGHAEYNLSHNTKERGVYTFCMCPGGQVIASSSEELGVVVNGMSEHARAGINSNSAVVCSIFKEDYGNSPIKAIEFQRRIEKLAYESAGGDYAAPVVTVGDFLNGEAKKQPSRIQPTYMNGENYAIVSPEKYLPGFVCTGIRNAILDFDRKIKGFASPDAILTGAETRTSSPVRILRNNDTGLALGKNNVYPAGEGAGYAGGITSAAIDGLKTALKIIKQYKPISDR